MYYRSENNYAYGGIVHFATQLWNLFLIKRATQVNIPAFDSLAYGHIK